MCQYWMDNHGQVKVQLIFFTQTSKLVTLQIVAFQPLTQRGMAQHGSAQTTAHALTAVQESSYTPHQKQKQHREYLIEWKCFSVKKNSLYWDRVKDIPPKIKGNIETIVTGPDVLQRIKALLLERLKPLHFVFESAENGIPLLWKLPANKIPLKADAQPRRCPKPRGENEAKHSIFDNWSDQKIFQNYTGC